MTKASGQDEISPSPEEKIEIIATGMIGSVLAAMEKKILQAIEDYEMPEAVGRGVKSKTPKPKTAEDLRVEKVNAERLEAFRKAKEKQNA